MAKFREVVIEGKCLLKVDKEIYLMMIKVEYLTFFW